MMSSGELRRFCGFLEEILDNYQRCDAIEISSSGFKAAARRIDDERAGYQKDLRGNRKQDPKSKVTEVAKFMASLGNLSTSLKHMARLLEGYGQADDEGASWPDNVPSLQAALVILDGEQRKIMELTERLIYDIDELIEVLKRPSSGKSSGDQAGDEKHHYRRDAVAEIAEYGRPDILPRTTHGRQRRA